MTRPLSPKNRRIRKIPILIFPSAAISWDSSPIAYTKSIIAIDKKYDGLNEAVTKLVTMFDDLLIGKRLLHLIIGLLNWMNIARIVRAETLSVKEREYVLYARVSGQSAFRIITMHIIPSISSTIIVAAPINIASAILMESTLSFLGLGIQQPDSSWGSMLNNAQGSIGEAPHLALFPGLFIFLTVLSFNVLGDVFRVAFEPKANER